MKKSSLFFIFLILISSFSFSQDLSLKVISAQGGYAILDDMTLEWTLGEPFIETLASSKNILTQGFHQSFNKTSSLSIKQENFFNSVVSPNPVTDQLHIHLKASQDSKLNLSLYEITGRFIKQTLVNSQDSNISINIMDLSSGTYILKISSLEDSAIEVHKIIKY